MLGVNHGQPITMVEGYELKAPGDGWACLSRSEFGIRLRALNVQTTVLLQYCWGHKAAACCKGCNQPWPNRPPFNTFSVSLVE